MPGNDSQKRKYEHQKMEKTEELNFHKKHDLQELGRSGIDLSASLQNGEVVEKEDTSIDEIMRSENWSLLRQKLENGSFEKKDVFFRYMQYLEENWRTEQEHTEKEALIAVEK